MNRLRMLALVLLGLSGAGVTRVRAAEEGELIAVLKSDAPLHDKADACWQLSRQADAAAVPVLVSLLGDKVLSDYARLALEPIDSAAVDVAFRQALGNLHGRPLIGVINSIGVRRDAKAVDALKALLNSEADDVAMAALAALGRIAPTDAVAAVEHALAKGPGARCAAAADTGLAAAQALPAGTAAKLYDAIQRSAAPPPARAAAAYQTMTLPGPAGLAALLEAFRSGDPGRVRTALHAAHALSGDEAATELATIARQISPPLAARLVPLLAARGTAAAREAVQALASSDDPVLRKTALEGLGKIGDAGSITLLLQAVGREDETAAAAVQSLATIRADGVEPAILKAMSGALARLRGELLEILARRGFREAMDEYLDAAASKDPALAGVGINALNTLGGPGQVAAMTKLLDQLQHERLRDDLERATAAAAGRGPDPDRRAEPVLQALTRARSVAMRTSLIRVLAHLGGGPACEMVRQACTDQTPEIRDAAVRSLAAWPDIHARTALFEIAGSSNNKAHRVLALRGAVRLSGMPASRPPAEMAGDYAKAMQLAATNETRKAVLGGLANVPHVKALELAVSEFHNPAILPEAAHAAVAISRLLTATDPSPVRVAMRKLLRAARVPRKLKLQAKAVVASIDTMAGVLAAWQVAGPYTKPGQTYQELFDVAFDPEQPASDAIAWKPVRAGTRPDRPELVDLLKALGGEQRAAYALTWVNVDRERPARLEMGSDDGIKAWVNGKLVHANNAARAAVAYSDRVDIVLHKGWNPLLLKITQNNLPWEFCARIRGRDGKPLPFSTDLHHDGNWRPKAVLTAAAVPAMDKATRIFDGKTFHGWEGNRQWFRIEDGAVVGGNLQQAIPRNEFLCTTEEYGNFQLRLKVKLVNNRGNAGIQIRSRRIPNHHEMIGYQADVAATYWGALYDESRRRKMLARPDAATLAKAVRVGDWNEYVIRCEGKRIQLWLNGIQTVDYTEPDPAIPQTGIIGLQIHGGPPSEVCYKDLEIKPLP